MDKSWPCSIFALYLIKASHKGTMLKWWVLHTWQPPEYKNLEMSRNLCIVRMSFKTMSKNNPRKSPKKHSERPGNLMKNLETPGKTGRVGRYGAHYTFWWLKCSFGISGCSALESWQVWCSLYLLVVKMQFWYLWVFSTGELTGMVLIVPFGG